MKDQRREEEERRGREEERGGGGSRREEELCSAFNVPVKRAEPCIEKGQGVKKLDGAEVRIEGEGKEGRWREEEVRWPTEEKEVTRPTAEEEEAGLEEELGALVQDMQGSQCSDGSHI